MLRGLGDKLLAGFVGLTFLVALALVGSYLIFSSLFFCRGLSCTGSIWTGLFLVVAGLLIFTFSLFGKYDTSSYLGPTK